MARISRFLVFGLQMSVSRTLTCPSPFEVILGVCLHFSTAVKSWCDAQAYCLSVGGELVRGSSFLSLTGKTGAELYSKSYWIGLTDFLVEKRTSQAGWRWSDGSLDPPSSELAWKPGQPSNPSNDCARKHIDQALLFNSGCVWKYVAMCQPRLPPTATRAVDFQAVSIPVGLPAEEFAERGGCTKVIFGVSLIECAISCTNVSEGCVSFYFNEAKRECRLVLYTDATIDMEDAQGWEKFVAKL